MQDVLIKEAVVADREETWVSESMDALRQSRLTALTAPQDFGGHGHEMYGLARICEELGKGYSSAGLCFGMHCMGTDVI